MVVVIFTLHSFSLPATTSTLYANYRQTPIDGDDNDNDMAVSIPLLPHSQYSNTSSSPNWQVDDMPTKRRIIQKQRHTQSAPILVELVKLCAICTVVVTSSRGTTNKSSLSSPCAAAWVSIPSSPRRISNRAEISRLIGTNKYFASNTNNERHPHGQQSQGSRRHDPQHLPLSMVSKQQLGTFEALEESQLNVPMQCNRKVLLLDYTKTDDGDDDVDADENLPSSSTTKAISSCLVDFQTAWDWQKELMERHFRRLLAAQQPGQQDQYDMNIGSQSSSSFLGAFDNDDDNHNENTIVGRGVDTIIMVEHRPVYTLGTGSDEKFVLSSQSHIPVVRMDRGGEVTYHGPGQLTVYPVLDLRSYKQDIHWYMRALEEATILALSRCGIDPSSMGRQDDVTGVWVQNHKVAAVGIKCRKWITMHGVAVNVDHCSLENFDGIVPCGLEGRKVGCINQFLMANGLPALTVQKFSTIMAEAMEEVFRIALVRESRYSNY